MFRCIDVYMFERVLVDISMLNGDILLKAMIDEHQACCLLQAALHTKQDNDSIEK